jgi:hypothetical protein
MLDTSYDFLLPIGDGIKSPQNQAFIVGQQRIRCQEWAAVLGRLCRVF